MQERDNKTLCAVVRTLPTIFLSEAAVKFREGIVTRALHVRFHFRPAGSKPRP